MAIFTNYIVFTGAMTIKTVLTRVAEVVRRQKGPSPKSFDLDEKFKPLHMLFCCNIKTCRELHTFWEDFGQKKCFLGSKTVFHGQEVHN